MNKTEKKAILELLDKLRYHNLSWETVQYIIEHLEVKEEETGTWCKQGYD